MKRLSATAVALLVTACTSSAPPTTPPPSVTPPTVAAANAPVTLTDADRAAVEAGVRANLGGAGNAAFRTMTATRGSDGAVSLCGYVDTGEGDKPYFGVLAAGAFSVTAMGGTPDETIAVQKACARRGIYI